MLCRRSTSSAGKVVSRERVYDRWRELHKTVYIILNMDKKKKNLHINSLQVAFIHPLEPCEAHFVMDSHTSFDVFWTVKHTHTHADCNDRA